MNKRKEFWTACDINGGKGWFNFDSFDECNHYCEGQDKNGPTTMEAKHFVEIAPNERVVQLKDFDEQNVINTVWNRCVLRARELNIDPQILVDACVEMAKEMHNELFSNSEAK